MRFLTRQRPNPALPGLLNWRIMNQVIIDYETRSAIDLKVVGAIEYAKHESTSILCVGYKIDDEPAKLWIPERGPMPDDLWEAFSDPKCVLKAHNVPFEKAITKYCLTRYDHT